MDVSKQVIKLEKELELWREDFRKGLLKDLGKRFLIDQISGNYTVHSHLEDYFFTIRYQENPTTQIPFGIVLPFREEKKAIFASPRNRNVYDYASKVFQNRGFKVERIPHQVLSGDEKYLAINAD